ncbi:hypothetical protein HELRODRAFT_175925 [Helobdella robusta]|uniref:Uncharacterized protein n=1 Tax=Helobdella robusta TaxID=6412 RepID=T1F9W6_HELRO|nr:hypothetical protein HELRODRAFT_175925 [Helobdella robusta]ESO00487.1 hypothetical protein HELRODRAFT_175925 [Helobdella robusta]
MVRSWHRIDGVKFSELIVNSSFLYLSESLNVDQSLQIFTDEFLKIADQAAPLRPLHSRFVSVAPWFDDDCRSLKVKWSQCNLGIVFVNAPLDVGGTCALLAFEECMGADICKVVPV